MFGMILNVSCYNDANQIPKCLFTQTCEHSCTLKLSTLCATSASCLQSNAKRKWNMSALLKAASKQ